MGIPETDFGGARHVYVHVPFCARRCSYCDFAIAVRRTVPVSEYVAALSAELETRFGGVRARPVDTIYFGGGTPSRLGGQGVARALESVRRHFAPVDNAEITIEVNPDDVTAESADRWRGAGVNRASLGAQTFSVPALAWMHRVHTPDQTARAVELLRNAGITNISLDLIFALPDAVARNLESDINRLLALEPSHISIYGLTTEPSAPFGKWVAAHEATEASEERYEAEYLVTHQLLTNSGYSHYEVSNYGKPGMFSRHNSSYWKAVPYVGLGPSAHGFDGRLRIWNIRQYAEWEGGARGGVSTVEGFEELTRDNRAAEQIYLGLRTQDGLKLTSTDVSFVRPWINAGWATMGSDGWLRCTPLGWLRLDALAAALTHHRSR